MGVSRRSSQTKWLKSNFDQNAFKASMGAFLRLCKSINTPRSLACYMLADAREFHQLLLLEIDPDRYDDAASFADDYLVTSVFKKTQLSLEGVDREAAALRSFYAAEEQCRETNIRLDNLMYGGVLPSSETCAVISHAQRIIAQVLGPLTRSKLDSCVSKARFGPGASSLVSGREVTRSRKYTRVMHVAPRLYAYWRALVPSFWAERIHNVEIVPFNKVRLVPKSWKTDRVIAIEPHLNGYIQLGIGAVIRQQLQRSGLNLDSQEANQSAARRASSEALATVDLSAASDTIARSAVWLLVPFEWASLLDTCRTEYGVMPDGSQVRYEKFSSMGNGFTFELESLLFWAVARASTIVSGSSREYEVLSYGDDIVVPRESIGVLLRALKFLGFKVNEEKTFTEGRFFESCGCDYFDGINVRPFFWKGVSYDTDESIVQMANSVRRYAHRRNAMLGCDRRFLPSWLHLIGKVSRGNAYRIPDGYGDGGIISNWDESTPTFAGTGRDREGWAGWLVPHRVFRAERRRRSETGALICALDQGGETPLHEPLRGSGFFQRDVLLAREWYDLGPWL